MQSTGHSSMHALSLMSTQGSAMTDVTGVSSVSSIAGPVGCWCGRALGSRRQYAVSISGRLSQCALTRRATVMGAAWLLILDVADTTRPVQHGAHAPMHIGAVQLVA